MEESRFVLSVVCPAYNEEQVLPLFHRHLAQVLAALPRAYQVEIVYVDDGSCDGTLDVLHQLAAQDARIRCLSFSRNFGHQAALTAGLQAARGDVVITLDSDLQHPPDLIPTLLEHWQAGSDVVVTIRDDHQSLGRLNAFLSRWFYRIMARLSDTEIRPAAADFRLMSRAAVNALLAMGERSRFLRGMVQWLGFPTVEVRYVPAPRGAGRSKYTFGRKLRFAFDGLFSFSHLPLRLPLVLAGLTAVIAGALLAHGLVGGAFGAGETATLRSLLIGLILLLGSAVFAVLGIFGEYLARIHDQVRGRPLFVLKEDSQAGLGGERPLRSSLIGPAVLEAEREIPAA